MLPIVKLTSCKDLNFLLFDTNDLISNSLKKDGVWEEYLLVISKFLLQNIPQPLVLDIGANLGAYCIPLAKEIASREGLIFAYEPQRIVYYQLCANIFVNSLDNIFAFNRALGDELGVVEIPENDYFTNTNIGAFSLIKEFRERNYIKLSINTIKSQIITMSKLDDENFSKEIDLIKIDVEGFELAVLRGATKLLKENNYPPILFEAWGLDWFATSRNELLYFLTNIGYEIFNLCGDNYIAQHPNNKIKVNFSHGQEGVIHFEKVLLK